MSKNSEKVMGSYKAELWSLSWVENVAGKWITANKFHEITGKNYKLS